MVEEFCLFSQELINTVSDSLYVTGIVKRIEHSFLKEVSNKELFVFLTTVQLFTLQVS